jgi:hypothetical protein
MRKLVIAVLLVMAAVGAAFANGNAEKLTAIEGTVLGVEQAGDLARIRVETQTREQVMVEVPAGEIERLQIRVQSRIRVEGVYIGVPKQQRLQARVLARVVNTGDGDVPVEEPLRLTLQERQQIRTWEREQAQDGAGTQTQTRTQTQTQDQQQTGKK